jgi:hypothetical protein
MSKVSSNAVFVRSTRLLFAAGALFFLTYGALVPGKAQPSQGVDASIRAAVEKAFGPSVQVQCYLNPCALAGDFDGDGKPDQAVLVSDQKSRRGVAVLFGSGASVLLGAGHPIGNGGDNFEWADEWKFVPKGAKQRLDAFTITSESGGGLLSWTKKGFVWTQHGD